MNRTRVGDEELSPLLPNPLDQDPAQAPKAQEVVSEDRDAPGCSVGDDARQCRICFEGEDHSGNPLISPCKCSGGSRYIHRECLAKWRSSALQNPRNQAAFRCEVCHYKYQFVRSDAAGLLSHPAAVATFFTLALSAACFLLGFVPVVQLCLNSFKIDFAHIAFVIHMVDGLLVVGLLGALLRGLDLCFGNRGGSDFCPAHCGCSFCYDASLFSGDCVSLAGMGAEGGVVCLVMVGLAAVLGLIMALPSAYMFLYKKIQEAAGATVRMVENVGHNAASTHKQQNDERV